MSRRVISWLLKLVVIFVLAAFYVVQLLPWESILWPSHVSVVMVSSMADIPQYPPLSRICMSLSVIPVYISLFLAWRIFGSISLDKSFSTQNVRRFRIIMWMALTDVALVIGLFIWIAVKHAAFINLALLLFAVSLVLIGLSAAIVCFALSKLVAQAAALKEESEWTI